MNLEDFQRIHFIGIGGAGMSSIARVLLSRGFQVSGSDIKRSRNTELLIEEGAQIKIGHLSENIAEADCIVISSAIPDSNVELQEAINLKKPILPRAKMLAMLKKDCCFIAIAGTHGKTTTTSITSVLFEKANLDPTYLIGGELNDIGSNARSGHGKYLIAEADESDGSFLYLEPDWAIVTNIENDHLDYYSDSEEIKISFLEFLRKIPDNGLVLVCGDQPNLQRLKSEFGRKTYTYGLDMENDVRAEDLILEKSKSMFNLIIEDNNMGQVEIPIPGKHNVYNALAAIYLAYRAGITIETIQKNILHFKGVQRRFQLIGKTPDKVGVIDDYAHHPTEIKATLEAAKQGGWPKIWTIFQPHRYSRTKFLWKEFGNSFHNSDVLILTDIYSAGENPEPGVTGKLVVDSVLGFNPNKKVIYIPKKDKILNFLTKNVKPGELVITMGAGDINLIGREYLEYYYD